MRILALAWKDLDHPAAGGSEVYVHEVARSLVAEAHEVTLFCAQAPGSAPSGWADGVRIIRRGGRLGVYREARRYYQHEARGQFDVVIDVVNTRPFLSPRYVHDVPVVALVHQVCREVWFYELSLPLAAFGRFVLEPAWLRGYALVPTLTDSASSAASLNGYGLADVSVVPMGSSRMATGVPPPREHRPTLIFLGRLTGSKRPDHALEAFRLVSQSQPDAQLWVVGTGPLEAALRQKASGQDVRFFGQVDAETKNDLLARAHVLISTSVREGWGLAVSEAAALGTSVVGYDVAGLRDSVGHAGGRLTRPDPASLARELVLSLPHELTAVRAARPDLLPEWSEVAHVVLGHLETALARA
jgi:glycosyltransferase involved in cell wall biosynthesis